MDRGTAAPPAPPHPGERPDEEAIDSDATPRLRPSRYYSWAELMARVFAVDVLECSECHGPMRILAAIHPPEATTKILEHLGLQSRPPPLAPPALPDNDALFPEELPDGPFDAADDLALVSPA